MRSPRKAALGKPARDPHRHRIELGIAVLARRLLAAEVDDRELGHVAVAIDQIAEILELSHLRSRDARYAAIATMSSALSLATTCFISSTLTPVRLPVCMSLSWRTR